MPPCPGLCSPPPASSTGHSLGPDGRYRPHALHSSQTQRILTPLRPDQGLRLNQPATPLPQRSTGPLARPCASSRETSHWLSRIRCEFSRDPACSPPARASCPLTKLFSAVSSLCLLSRRLPRLELCCRSRRELLPVTSLVEHCSGRSFLRDLGAGQVPRALRETDDS